MIPPHLCTVWFPGRGKLWPEKATSGFHRVPYVPWALTCLVKVPSTKKLDNQTCLMVFIEPFLLHTMLGKSYSPFYLFLILQKLYSKEQKYSGDPNTELDQHSNSQYKSGL